MTTIVYYHADKDCTDGFTAAWLLWLVFGRAAKYIPARYGDIPDEADFRGNDVFVVDFSFPREIVERMYREAHTFVLWDHHPSAQRRLGDMPCCEFDLSKSGAAMTLERLQSSGSLSKGNAEFARELVEYTQDRDLWTWFLPASREINACISLHTRSFPAWSLLAVDLKDSFHTLVSKGKVILRAQEHYVELTAKQVYKTTLVIDHPDFPRKTFSDIPTINAPPWCMSELLHHLAQGHPFALGWFRRADGVYECSLRAGDVGAPHVGRVAEAFGGGGHSKSAGFISHGGVPYFSERTLSALKSG
jgi:oligoribonuclease NrnB/cAMP/cGMP phosphodiesterase (DHH superfamily)